MHASASFSPASVLCRSSAHRGARFFSGLCAPCAKAIDHAAATVPPSDQADRYGSGDLEREESTRVAFAVRRAATAVAPGPWRARRRNPRTESGCALEQWHDICMKASRPHLWVGAARPSPVEERLYSCSPRTNSRRGRP